MNCPQCGATADGVAQFCQSCGANLRPQPQSSATTPSNPATGSSGFSLTRLGRGDLGVGGGTLVLLISLFLPWYTATLTGGGSGIAGGSNSPSASVSALGDGAGGWRFLILILCVAILGYLVVRAFRPLSLPLPHWQVLGIATGLNLLLTLIGLIATPSSAVLSAEAGFGISISLDFGVFISLVAAALAVVFAYLRSKEPELIGPDSAASQVGLVYATSPGFTKPGAASSTRFCASCGAQVATADQFCTSCGAAAAP